jgi:hypothetical protein
MLNRDAEPGRDLGSPDSTRIERANLRDLSIT